MDSIERESAALSAAAMPKGHEFMTMVSEVRKRHGFLGREHLKVLVKYRRLEMVLGRCGGCRFRCPAQDAQPLMDIIERDGKDYVRDVTWKEA